MASWLDLTRYQVAQGNALGDVILDALKKAARGQLTTGTKKGIEDIKKNGIPADY